MLSQRGFSLLEAMIAGVVASLGLSGVAALLIASVAGTSEAEHRSLALDLAVQMTEAMALSPLQEAVFLAPPPSIASACGIGDGCDAAGFAAAGVHDWHLLVGLALPGGGGRVCRDGTPDDGDAATPACDGAGGLVVKVFWREPAGEQREVLEAGP